MEPLIITAVSKPEIAKFSTTSLSAIITIAGRSSSNIGGELKGGESEPDSSTLIFVSLALYPLNAIPSLLITIFSLYSPGSRRIISYSVALSMAV